MNTPRLPYHDLTPDAFKALAGLSASLHASSLGRALCALVDLRVSQINGCAYCLDMHAREFLAADGDLQRLNGVAAWREAGFYTERERAALQWAESVTLLTQGGAPQAHFDALRLHFSEREIVELTTAIAVINAWNRISVGMATPVAARAMRVTARA